MAHQHDISLFDGVLPLLARLEKTGSYEIELVMNNLRARTEGSGFAIITIENGDWVVKFKTQVVADS